MLALESPTIILLGGVITSLDRPKVLFMTTTAFPKLATRRLVDSFPDMLTTTHERVDHAQ